MFEVAYQQGVQAIMPGKENQRNPTSLCTESATRNLQGKLCGQTAGSDAASRQVRPRAELRGFHSTACRSGAPEGGSDRKVAWAGDWRFCAVLCQSHVHSSYLHE